MKKISLFTFILVLMLSLVSAFSFAYDNKEDASTITEISEEIDTETNTTDEQATSDQPLFVVASATIENASAESSVTEESQDVVTQEQDQLKVKKLNAVKAFIKSKNPKLSDAVVTKVAEAALYANQKNKMDLSLILAVMWKESTFSPSVITGPCYGVMQIHKNTAAGFGYKVADIQDPYRAAELGSRLIKSYIAKYNQNLVIALTAYNQGTGNVARGNYNTNYAKNVINKQAAIQAYLDAAMSK